VFFLFSVVNLKILLLAKGGKPNSLFCNLNLGTGYNSIPRSKCILIHCLIFGGVEMENFKSSLLCTRMFFSIYLRYFILSNDGWYLKVYHFSDGYASIPFAYLFCSMMLLVELT